MKPTTVTWACPHCERDTTVTVHPCVPAKLCGRPEDCHPAEGGGIYPAHCPNCDAPIDVGACIELACDKEADALAARADELADRRRDEGR
jgi:hypothetical protein